MGLMSNNWHFVAQYLQTKKFIDFGKKMSQEFIICLAIENTWLKCQCSITCWTNLPKCQSQHGPILFKLCVAAIHTMNLFCIPLLFNSAINIFKLSIKNIVPYFTCNRNDAYVLATLSMVLELLSKLKFKILIFDFNNLQI